MNGKKSKVRATKQWKKWRAVIIHVLKILEINYKERMIIVYR